MKRKIFGIFKILWRPIVFVVLAYETSKVEVMYRLKKEWKEV